MAKVRNAIEIPYFNSDVGKRFALLEIFVEIYGNNNFSLVITLRCTNICEIHRTTNEYTMTMSYICGQCRNITIVYVT